MRGAGARVLIAENNPHLRVAGLHEGLPDDRLGDRRRKYLDL